MEMDGYGLTEFLVIEIKSDEWTFMPEKEVETKDALCQQHFLQFTHTRLEHRTDKLFQKVTKYYGCTAVFCLFRGCMLLQRFAQLSNFKEY
jgi:hypothetical protein